MIRFRLAIGFEQVIARRRTLLIIVLAVAGSVVAATLLLAWAQTGPPGDGITTFRTRQRAYVIGDTVEFYLAKGGANPVTLGNLAPWRVEREIATGVWLFVYAVQAPAILDVVQPGQTRTWTWIAENRTEDPTRIPVEAGAYRVAMSVGFETQGIEMYAYFSLREPGTSP